MEFVHKSIMLEEVIESLAIKPNGIYVDGTLGGAGHSSERLCRQGYHRKKQLCTDVSGA